MDGRILDGLFTMILLFGFGLFILGLLVGLGVYYLFLS